MSNENLSFHIEPLPTGETLERHIFRDRLEYDLKFDERLPTEHGGAEFNRRVDPTVPVASWLLARLTHMVGDHFRKSFTVNEDQEFVVQLLGRRDGTLIGPVLLTFVSNGEVRALFQAADVVETDALHQGLKNALLSSPSEVGEISIEFPEGQQYGRANGNFLGHITPEFSSAELVDKLIAGEFVEKLTDDRIENCPIGIDRIAGMLSESKKPVAAKQVRYLQSAQIRDGKAWVFKVSRRDLYAVVVWKLKEEPEIQLVG